MLLPGLKSGQAVDAIQVDSPVQFPDRPLTLVCWQATSDRSRLANSPVGFVGSRVYRFRNATSVDRSAALGKIDCGAGELGELQTAWISTFERALVRTDQELVRDKALMVRPSVQITHVKEGKGGGLTRISELMYSATQSAMSFMSHGRFILATTAGGYSAGGSHAGGYRSWLQITLYSSPKRSSFNSAA